MKMIYINSKEELNVLHDLIEGGEYVIVLCKDLDLKDYSIRPINFVNTNVIFDGNLHSISNLSINLPNEDNVGLFNTIGDSTMVIKDLELSGDVEGRENVGLVGGLFNGYINNSRFEGSTVGINNVGGLVGKSTKKLGINSCELDMEYPACSMNLDGINIGYVAGNVNELHVSMCTYDVSCEKLSNKFNELTIKPKKILKRSK